jgi:glycosyltransferase involved in cell wall biosynthesis
MLEDSIPLRLQPYALAEIAALELADEIAAPSLAVAEAAVEWTGRARGKISVFPYAFQPSQEFLHIPAGGRTNRVTYLGRLEERKGVIDLADSIPTVLAAHPEARFRFVGMAMGSPRKGQDMQAFLAKRLSQVANAVEFAGPVSPSEIPRVMAETDILVAPSHWESFGLVCCEGMAAARAVIGSSAGGMVEILDKGRCGLLAKPREPSQLANLILQLLGDPEKRRLLGEAGRRRVLENYAPPRFQNLQMASYQRAITRCQSRLTNRP